MPKVLPQPNAECHSLTCHVQAQRGRLLCRRPGAILSAIVGRRDGSVSGVARRAAGFLLGGRLLTLHVQRRDRTVQVQLCPLVLQ
jgi:hypothetical protein